ncbi:hypothetical protein RUND412_010511 [Rhizina undulata]
MLSGCFEGNAAKGNDGHPQQLLEDSSNGHEDNQLDAYTPASKQPDPQSVGVSGTEVNHVENPDHARSLTLVDRISSQLRAPTVA